jgi:hypothetical protein
LWFLQHGVYQLCSQGTLIQWLTTGPKLINFGAASSSFHHRWSWTDSGETPSHSFPLFNFQYLYQRLPLCVNLIQPSHVEYAFSGVKKGCSFKPSISDVLYLKNLLMLSLFFSLSLMNCVLWSEMRRLDGFILRFRVRSVKRWNHLVIW